MDSQYSHALSLLGGIWSAAKHSRLQNCGHFPWSCTATNDWRHAWQVSCLRSAVRSFAFLHAMLQKRDRAACEGGRV